MLGRKLDEIERRIDGLERLAGQLRAQMQAVCPLEVALATAPARRRRVQASS